jgi:hypothetical protein
MHRPKTAHHGREIKHRAGRRDTGPRVEITGAAGQPEQQYARGGDADSRQRARQAAGHRSRMRHFGSQGENHKDRARNDGMNPDQGFEITTQTRPVLAHSVNGHGLQKQTLISHGQKQENREYQGKTAVLFRRQPAREHNAHYEIRSRHQPLIDQREAGFRGPAPCFGRTAWGSHRAVQHRGRGLFEFRHARAAHWVTWTRDRASLAR